MQNKKDRAEGGKTIVCVSDRWTLEYDLALYGCAKLMYLAITLAEKAKSRDERLEEADETTTLTAAELNWATLEKAGHSPEKLASIIYKPLYENDASKAIAAQYAAHLIRTGNYGRDEVLFNKLPPYLKTALSYLTTKPTTGSTAPIVTPSVSPSITTSSMPEGVK